MQSKLYLYIRIIRCKNNAAADSISNSKKLITNVYKILFT